MNNRWKIGLLIVPLMLSGLSACVKKNNNSSGGDSVPGVDNYEEWLDEWSEAGHLYIHYLRPDASEAEYSNYAIWIWQCAPKDLEGSLWGASNKEVQANFHCMSTSWMTNIGGKKGLNKDKYGHVIDIDMTRTDIVDGKKGKSVSYDGATKVGFLIVDQRTMGGGSHWTSDGGANMYITDFQSHWREGSNSMHIFCTQGSVADYTFDSESSETVEINPTITDTTGAYRSTNNVDSSKPVTKISKTSDSFSSLGVGYQVFVASFRDSNNDGFGDIRGVTKSIEEGFFEDLGVDVLWLTPVQTCESYHGYDSTDYYTIDERFGTLEDYRELLKTAHDNNMKVLMDLVLNHTSKNNLWFKKSQKALVDKDSGVSYRDMYHWKYKGDKVLMYDLEKKQYVKVNVENHKDWYRDGESNYYYYAKFGSGMPELNYDCQLTRDLVKELALYWLGFGLDGFRLDAVKHIYMKDEVYLDENGNDTGANDMVIYDISNKTYYDEEKLEYVIEINDYSSNLTKNINFWSEFANGVKAIYPDCFLVGENFDGYGARIAPYINALDSQFDFSNYYHTLENIYQGANGWKSQYYSSTQQAEVYNVSTGTGSSKLAAINKKVYRTLDDLKNETNPINLSFPSVTVPMGKRSDFINGAFTSNHDVLRAMNHVNGDLTELTADVPNAVEKGKVAAMVTLLQPGLSWIYYGDELGMSSNTNTQITLYDNENNEDIWYRQPYKWGATDGKRTVNYSFGRYKVEWDAYNKQLASWVDQSASADDNDMYDVYCQLTKIKGLYGKNTKMSGMSFNDNSDVIYFKVTSNAGTFNVYIHTAATNTNNVRVNVNANSTYYINGATGNTLKPYSAIVVKE